MLKAAVAALAAGVSAPAASAATSLKGDSKDKRELKSSVALSAAVKEANESFPRDEVSKALDALRNDGTSATVRDVPGGEQLEPQGTSCRKVRRWQVIAVSFAMDAGTAISKIAVPSTGGIKWPSLLKMWHISAHGSGSGLRSWIKTQSWPKTVCVSDDPA